MKKTLLFLTSALMVCYAQSQWDEQTNGTDVTTTYNVGIGTTSPTDKLHVYDGNIRQTILGSSSQWIYLIQSLSYNSGIWANSGNPALYLRNVSGDLNTIIRPDGKSFLKGGNVGIGTSNPLSPLHLLQTDEKGLRFERSAHDNYEIRLAHGDGLNILNVSDSRYEMSFDGDGNVGIGTSNPAAKLESMGAIRINSTTPVLQFKENDNVDNNFQLDVSGGNFNIRTNNDAFNSADIRMSVNPNGNVGIGTTSPSEKLDINGTVKANFLKMKAISSSEGGEIMLEGPAGYNDWRVDNRYGHFRLHHSGNLHFQVFNDGRVAIGTTSTGSHKLAVEGSIGAREIKVEATGWSDFVFDNDYSLRTLEEVEQFILKNNHLPDIPSEKEVVEGGINLGEMNAKLLQKIEELTLYLIEQNKEIKTLKKEIESLKSE